MQNSVGTSTLARVTVLLTTVVLLFAVMFTSGAEADTAAPQTDLHVVQPGDTLWNLASRQTPAGGDVWATVDVIRDLNEIDGSTLYAGDQLVVPAAG